MRGEREGRGKKKCRVRGERGEHEASKRRRESALWREGRRVWAKVIKEAPVSLGRSWETPYYGDV